MKGIHLRDYGATLNGSGVGDSLALQKAINDINSGVVKSAHINFDGHLVLTTPPPIFDRHYLHGDNIYGSVVSKTYPGSYYFRFEGRPGYSGGGLSDFSIPTTPASVGSYMVLARATAAGYAPDGLELKNLYLGSGIGANSPFRIIDLNGTARTSPYGARQCRFINVTCFGATGGCSMYMDGTVDFVSWALRFYQGSSPYYGLIYGATNINPDVR